MSLYNNYYPYNYYPQYQQVPQINQQTQNSQQSGSITWVDGENAARSYMVGAGQSVMLMDSNSNVFYIKSADQSGMPLPLRIFDYSERVSHQNQDSPQAHPQSTTPEYITRDEFERRISELVSSSPIKKINQTVRKDKAE